MSPPGQYTGPALFSFGFRPFFLAACLFALIVPVWLPLWRGGVEIAGPFTTVDWHIHEMIFGYGAAVVAGFLFTAIPNWTGRMPTRGAPLAVLLGLWLLGRLAVAGVFPVGPVAVLAVDAAFLLAVAAMVAREIIAGRNWRNLKVVIPVSLLLVANILFHAEVMSHGVADSARRLGLGVLIFLIMLIGGRIVPSFTRNWLAKRGAQRMPVPFGRFDAVALAAGGCAMAAWVAAPFATVTGVLLCVGAAAHFLRLARWRGLASWRSPLLLMLHVAYLFIPAGMLGAALTAFSLLPPEVGAHLFGIGAMGGMTIAVMMRATMGHTGRELVAGPVLTVAFSLLVLAVAARIAWREVSVAGMDGLSLAAGLWSFCFVLLLLRLGPWLATPRAARRRPNTPAHGA